MIGFIAGLFVGAFLGSVAMAVMAYRKHVALEAEIDRAEDKLWDISELIFGVTRIRTSRLDEVLNRD